MKWHCAPALLAAFAVSSCGGRGDRADDLQALDNAVVAVAPADNAANPDRHDPVLGLFGTEQMLGAVHPDCAAFPPATGSNSVLGVAPGMTLPQASSTLRCQFSDLRHYDNRQVYFHSFTGIRHGPNARRSFGVEIPGNANRPVQQVDVYLAGGMNRERVFAIRTAVYYDEANRVPVETVTNAVTGKYGPLIQERRDAYPISVGRAPPDPFCLGFIGVDYVYPSNGTYSSLNIPWDQIGACGTRLYYNVTERNGIAERMMLLLIDFSMLPDLHAQELAAVERTRQQGREDELRRARENAERGGAPRL